MKKFLIIVLLVSVIGFPLAAGHPFTEKTEPAQSSNVPAGLTQIIIHYSEALEADFSELKVLDSNGNQVDNKDTAYYEGEDSLIVTTPPLEDGVYTVTSKVLSKVDGHLVDYAFVFAVGDVKIDPSLIEQQGTTETLFFPEAGARFPGLVGQTIVLGAVISSLLIWNSQKKNLIKENFDKIQKTFHDNFMRLTGIGLIVVFVSNILMLAAQTIRLEVSALDALQTSFGNTWMIRMGITIVLLAIWFAIERKPKLSIKYQIPLLVFSLALIATTTMMGHGAASKQTPPIVLDYIHNLVSAVWIGGIIFFGFALLPTINNLENEKKETFSLKLIPRFSILFIISVGIIIISGPTLLWFLESDVGLLTKSTYGMLIIAKIVIATIMIALGGYKQFKIQKSAEKNLKTNSISVHKKLRRSLKIEAVLGIVLLGVVALLTNGSLPAGEVQEVQAQQVTYGFSAIEFSQQAKFQVSITPFSSGQNTISVSVTDPGGNPLNDLDGLKVKVSNPQRNIAPIEIPMNQLEDEDGNTIFEGKITFGFSGNWQIEIEALRTQNANEGVILSVLVKPKLSELKTEITEYDLPDSAARPLYPVYGGGTIWISDPAKPRIWKFTLDDKKFESFEFDGQTSVVLAIDRDGKIWFTDPPGNQIGFINPETEQIELISLGMEAVLVGLEVDLENNVWVAVFDKNILLKYNQGTKDFEQFPIPTESSGPFALLLDPTGQLWFTESQAGKIGVINTESGEIQEFSPQTKLESPEALYFDTEGNLWVAEHTGLRIAKFNLLLKTFERITVPDPDALPFGMAEDRFGNIWFAQHTIDKLAVYDPHNNNLIELDIPTQQSFVQFMTSDDDNNIWFVEQTGVKLGILQISETPSLGVTTEPLQQFELKYAELVSPLISMGIIATSLFFVKAVNDKRRIDSLTR